MDAAGELAQLVQRCGELVARLGRELLALGRVAADRALGSTQLQRDGDEALLRAVVEVALEPPALGVAGLDDPRA